MSDPVATSPNRSELVLRRYTKTAWIIVAVGVIVPVLAAAGAYRGWRLVQWGRRSEGLPLLLAGAIVFVVRLALWASTGSTSAF